MATTRSFSAIPIERSGDVNAASIDPAGRVADVNAGR